MQVIQRTDIACESVLHMRRGITVWGCVQVRASSPLCRHTDAKAMVDSRLSRSNMAGPRQTGGDARASWWSLDLGQHHRLACNYYTLRHDASSAFLRNWVLQVCV